MLNSDFFNLSLSLQAAIAAGYLGYATAYAGYRRGHKAEDTLFISLVFSAIALLCFGAIEPCYGPVLAFGGAFAGSLVSACLWRVAGRPIWCRLMAAARVHREDGVHRAWDCIVQSGRGVGQISVGLKSGRILYLNDRRKFHGSPWDGLYLGGDGSISMAVEEEKLPGGIEEVRQGVRDKVWGTRLTYIPAGEVARVNIRMR